MRSDHYTRSKKELQKNILKIVLGVLITSLVAFLPVGVKGAWESILCDVLMFAGLALVAWGLLGWRIAHKQTVNT